MMQVAHFVGPSGIAGAGLMAGADIAPGTVIYRYNARFVLILDDAELDAMPTAVRTEFIKYCYRGKGEHRLSDAWYYCADDARFFNHTDDPNAIWDDAHDAYVAVRAINAGDEITCDYRSFSEPGDYAFIPVPTGVAA